ncbi:MAG: SDR family NAD(P)-dependent oxidoreductase [Roseateles sp.]|uniref:SDR family NAD(P)-dependent oxidoreductase n=1 Tax=Roseateles sp. TaxID=1971397 RepID=UPI0039E8672E
MRERVAFVTGASRGIGAACATALAQDGYRLVLHASRRESLDALLASLPPNADTLIVAYDMADTDSIGKAFQLVFKQFRRLDVLVNNAGVMEPAKLGMISQQALSRTLDVNLAAAILHMQGAAKLMTRAGHGAIVNMTSIVGRFGFEGQVPYSAAKAGLIGATLAAAKELAAQQVRVNAVAPGYIDTALNRQHHEDVHRQNLARVRMGRMGAANEVADLIRFLASDRATYITGQVIGIDGGMSL